MTLLDICKQISNKDIKVKVKTIDLFYDYKYKNNKIVKREETIIVLTTEFTESIIFLL